MTVQLKQLGDKTYYVLPGVPVVKATVMNGTVLPLQELKKSVQAWNMKPVVFGHPKENGIHVSASKESQIPNHVGFVTNSRMDGERMRSDLFLEKNKIDNHPDGGRLLQLAKAKKPINVSTGYFDRVEQGSGIKDGKVFVGTQADLSPDHLAILLDEKGACACEHGCGINVNQDKGATAMSEESNHTETTTEQTSAVPTAEDIAAATAAAASEAIEQAVEKAVEKLTTNAATAFGSAQEFKTMMQACMDTMGKVNAFLDDYSKKNKKMATNGSDAGEDNDEEDFETMKKKNADGKDSDSKDKKVTANSDQAKSETTHTVSYKSSKSLQVNALQSSPYFMPSIHDYLNQNKGAK